MESTAPPVIPIAEVAEYLRIPRAPAIRAAHGGRMSSVGGEVP